MKKTILILLVFSMFSGCKEEVDKKPNRLIEKNVMVDIMYDLTILEAIRYQNPMSLETYQINPTEYIYKKYKIDSLQFAQNNAYYASDYTEYRNMFDEISKRLDKNKPKVDTLSKVKLDKKIKPYLSKKKKLNIISADSLKKE